MMRASADEPAGLLLGTLGAKASVSRDHAMLLTDVQTGLRVSELLGLTCADVQLDAGAHLRAFGKGRKERVAPLTRQTVAVLKVWMRERDGQPKDPLFPTRSGGTPTRDAIERRLAKHLQTAQRQCPTLQSKRVSMHTLRHYVDGWVMWPAGVFPLLGLSRASVPAT
jgi:integrase